MNESESDKKDDEPKIVVDTDWKEQVAREKAQAESGATSDSESGDHDPAETENDPATAASEPATVDSSDGEDDTPPPPPPATFEVLISMMFTQAMAMLGQMPDPATGEARVNKPYAKHYIDTMEMLGEKTEGNLTDDEKKVLSEAMHAIRMMYVNVKA